MSKRYKICYMLGDGIGPEVMKAALSVLRELASHMEFVELRAGLEYYKRTGVLLEEQFFEKVKECDAVIKGPLQTPLGPGTHRSVNVMIRQELNLYANVRPFTSYKGVSLSTFDLTIIRENTEDLYVGIEGKFGNIAFSMKVISESGSRRIARFAFDYARSRGYKRVTVVHKANILKETDGLFRRVFFEEAEKFSDIKADEMIVDAAAYKLVKSPEEFQIILTPNLYGDILSDLAAGIVGSIGLCGSAQIGDNIAVFEPIHGTAPDIAGKNVANPIGGIIAAKLMLEYLALRYGDSKARNVACAIERGVRRVVESRVSLPRDLGGSANTQEVADAVKEASIDFLRSFSV
uniref:Isocitrate/isopropylmalate dehydrogenase family protein n=1 Tax=Fervidicoccus fontis TaxID=683846 RepID=A0A7J3ZLG7_9CREN